MFQEFSQSEDFSRLAEILFDVVEDVDCGLLSICA